MRGGILLGTVFAGALCAGAAAADPALDKILACMRANVPPTLRIQDLELQATDRAGGTRTLKGRLYALRERGLLRAMLRVTAPPDLAGAAYLVRETQSAGGADEMYMYLPALNRVRRIAGASADASFLGTDFSYNELKQIENAFDDADGKLEAPTQLEGRPVEVLSFHPRAQRDSRYSALRVFVDRQTCVALKVEFYEAAAPRKVLSAPASALAQSGHYWYATQAEMRDLKDGTRTVLRITGVTSGAELAARYFDPHSFYLGN
jgi:hypothetical protein